MHWLEKCQYGGIGRKVILRTSEDARNSDILARRFAWIWGRVYKYRIASAIYNARTSVFKWTMIQIVGATEKMAHGAFFTAKWG